MPKKNTQAINMELNIMAKRQRKAPDELAPARISFMDPIARGLIDGSVSRVSYIIVNQPGYIGKRGDGIEHYHLLTSPRSSTTFTTDQVITELQTSDAKPYGEVGRRHWLSEGWRAQATYDQVYSHQLPRKHTVITYNLDLTSPDLETRGLGRYRQPRDMPRWASRILLQVTDIEVSRIQSITPIRAMAEGAKYTPDPAEEDKHTDVLLDFAERFDALNGEGSWLSNPWVWGYQFTRI